MAKMLNHVQTAGAVNPVRLESKDPPAEELADRFEEEIRKAMREWRYVPANKIVPGTVE